MIFKKTLCFISLLIFTAQLLLTGCSEGGDMNFIPPLYDSVLVIDHNSIEKFDDIPDEFLTCSRTFLIQYVGQSHGRQIPHGLEILEAMDSKYSVQMGTDLSALTSSGELKVLRSQRQLTNIWSGDSIGEEGFWAVENGRLTTENTGWYCISEGRPLKLSLWCWCWDICNENFCNDESGTLITFNDERRNAYLNSIARFNRTVGQTVYVYVTSITDTSVGEKGWRVTKYNADIRSAAQLNGGILFDQADIENWNSSNSEQRTDLWDGHTLYLRHSDYDESVGVAYSDGHTNEDLCVRKAKALWVLLAKYSGWKG